MAFNHRKMLVYCIRTKDLNVCYHQQYLPPPPPPPLPQRELSLLLPTTIWVAGSILLFLFLVIFLYLYLTQPRRTSAATVTPGNTNRRREDEEETDERELSDFHHVWRIPTVGLHRSEINSITVVGFKKGEGLIDDTECSVCLNEFEENESLRLLPKCSHAFHINCIDTWLHSHKNCPLCRAPVLPLTKPPHPHQQTDTNHHQSASSESSNNLSGGQGSSRSRNLHILTRAQSDLANHCGTGRVENVRRSSSIGGSLSLCDVDNIATRSGRQLYTSFSAVNLFSSSRRSRNQEPVLPSVSDNTS